MCEYRLVKILTFRLMCHDCVLIQDLCVSVVFNTGLICQCCVSILHMSAQTCATI